MAAEKAAAGDPSLTKRIAFLKKGLKDAELTVATRRAQKEMELAPTPSSKEKFKKAFHKMAAYRAAIEKDNICNYSHMAYWEKNGSSWPWKYIKLQ